MLFPEKKLNCIGVAACSDGRTDEKDILRIRNGCRSLEERGYRVLMADHVIGGEKGRSADAATRAEEFMKLVKDPEVSCVIQACGGDYLCEVLPYLNYNEIAKDPKWYQGFSDPTGILYSILTLCDMATIYGGNFSDFGMENWHESLDRNMMLLTGTAFDQITKSFIQTSYQKYQPGFTEKITGLEGFDLTEDVCWKAYDKEGKQTDQMKIIGRQIGGCLDCIINLLGTPYERTVEFVSRYGEDGMIWCLETFEMGAAALTRSLWQMRQAGWFQNAKGFVFGRPTFFRDDYGYSYEESVYQALGDLKLPMIFDADFGHRPPRMPIILGGMGQWELDGKKGVLTQWMKD